MTDNVMDDAQRLQLQKMIKANNVEDQTELIRKLKHSQILRSDINNLMMLKVKHRDNEDALNLEAMTECSFLFTYYTDIYNKVRKDEIDLSILNKFLGVLERIENGELDQHEGSFLIGSLLKQLYIDSALKKADKLNAESDQKEPEYKGPQVEISWRDWKAIQSVLHP